MGEALGTPANTGMEQKENRALLPGSRVARLASMGEYSRKKDGRETRWSLSAESALRLAVSMGVFALQASSALAAPGPGPGESFGGDDSGCVPQTSALRQCSDSAAKAYSKLETAINKCHNSLASTRYSQVIEGSTKVFDEEACEADAQQRFDSVLFDLSDGGDCDAGTLLLTAPDAAIALETDLDARGADLYCDATSGTSLDPGGDDDGDVPATRDAVGCTRRATISLGKLAKAVVRCHQRAAADGLALRDPAFDEDGCEAEAQGKYAQRAASLLADGVCPACVDSPLLVALCEGVLDRLDADDALLYPCPDPVLHADTALLDRPTLMALGVQLPISGDANRDATVSLRYRKVGDVTWKDALPLLRVQPETVPSGDGTIAEQFAGSIFDLRPATDYELELHLVDADGPVDETQLLTATTRALPADPVAPNPLAVANATQLAAALAAAAPGDVITLADGVYAGPFELDANGTAANPIVIRGTTRDDTILDGNDCESCNVLEVYGSYVHVEKLTLQIGRAHV